jgi:hypothetical protein
MRQLIENPVYVTIDDMKKTFKGKWIYIVKCDMADGNELIGGFPVVVADTPFEGDVRFYDQFKGKDFSPRCQRNFNRKEQFFFSDVPT